MKARFLQHCRITVSRQPARAALRLGLLICLALGGCANKIRRSEAPVAGASTMTDAAVTDAAAQPPPRRLMPLEAITPLPVPPDVGSEGPPLSERGATQIAAAQRLMAEQRYTEAALELERALRYDPLHPAVHRTLAWMHVLAGNRDRARAHVVRTLELRPDDAAAHYLQGRVLHGNGDTAAAILAYRTALLCPPARRDLETTLLTRFHLAAALAAEGYDTAALEQYATFEREAADLSGEVASTELSAIVRGAALTLGNARAELYERLDRPGDAADALRSAVAAAPHDYALALRRARLLQQAGRLDEALKAARDIPPEAPDVLKLLADVHSARGTTRELMTDLQNAIARSPGASQPTIALADLYAAEGRSADAVDLLRAQLGVSPEAVELRLRLLDNLQRTRQWHELLSVAGDGLRLHPARGPEWEDRVLALRDDPQALRDLLDAPADGASPQVSYLTAVLARAAERRPLAEERLTAAVRADPTFIPAREALARMYLASLEYDRALAAAARRDPEVAEDPRLERTLGDIFERLDNTELAEQHYQAAVQLDRRNADAMMRLADIYARSDRALQAQRQLRALLDVDPRHDAARETLAFLLLRQGKVDAALQQFHELRSRAATPAIRARSEILAAQYPRIQPDAYRQAILQAMRDSAPDAASWVIIAETYDEDAEIEQRFDAYAQALRADPDHEEAALGLVAVARRLLRFEEAARRMEALLPSRPNRHAWRFALIELYWIIQDYDRALALAESQERRIDIDDQARTAYRLRIVDSLRMAQRPDEAIRRVAAWADASGDRTWRQRLAALYMQDDRPVAAAALYEELYNSSGGMKNLLSDLVEALGAADRHDRAVQLALEWLLEDPAHDRAVALTAFALSAARRPDDTLELIRAHLETTLNRESFQELYMRQLRIAGRPREAIQWIESLLDDVSARLHDMSEGRPRRPDEPTSAQQRILRPNEPFSFDNLVDRLVKLRTDLAETHLAARQYADAERLLREWLEDTRDRRQRLEYLRRLADCFQIQGQDVRSTEILEQMLALAPNSVLISNDLAYGWIDHGQRLPEAERLIRFALASEPRQGAYLDTYGWLLYKKGEFAEARKWLERANRDRQDDDPVVLDHLGDTLWRLGEKERAIARWEKAAARAAAMKEEEIFAADLRRVRAGTAAKVEEARAGREPVIAPLAPSPEMPQPAPDSR